MQATDSAVRREITVNATPERAFYVFTEQFDTWWPRSHKIGEADMAKAVIDPDAMRWYEVGVDGSTCDWGAILAYDPPRRLTLEWRIGGTWVIETDPAAISEIDVTFTPEGDATRVTLEHRHLDEGALHRAGLPVLDGHQGVAVDALDETVSQGIEGGAERAHLVAAQNPLLDPSVDRAVVDERSAGMVEKAEPVEVTVSQLGDLAGASRDWICMAIRTR